MSELSLIVKMGALLILGVGALIIAYKCAGWIYRTVLDTPPAPQADSKPVPDDVTQGQSTTNASYWRQESSA